jgi:hypothetical protein
MGRKWTGRDRAVARKVIAWYQPATGDVPVSAKPDRVIFLNSMSFSAGGGVLNVILGWWWRPLSDADSGGGG